MGCPNLRESISRARSLGCTVSTVRRTGEIRFSHRSMPMSVTVNGRRKDTPRHLLKFLREIEGNHGPGFRVAA